MNPSLTVTILGAGLGKRMKSPLPKVLHEVSGVPMLVKVLEQSLKLQPAKILVVVGQYKPVIEETLAKWNMLDKISFAIQEPALGTGHAVLCTLDQLSDDGYNIILNGDSPLLTAETISNIINPFVESDADLQITSVDSPNPTGCGRIIKDDTGKFLRIVEQKDCTDQQGLITEINIGIYIAKNKILKRYIPMIKNQNAQNEFYLTDIVELYANNEAKTVGLIRLPDSKLPEIANVNTIEELNRLNQSTTPSEPPSL